MVAHGEWEAHSSSHVGAYEVIAGQALSGDHGLEVRGDCLLVVPALWPGGLAAASHHIVNLDSVVACALVLEGGTGQWFRHASPFPSPRVTHRARRRMLPCEGAGQASRRVRRTPPAPWSWLSPGHVRSFPSGFAWLRRQ